MGIDTVDYAILKIVGEHDRPAWKNRIHELLTDQVDEIPEVDSVSVQTVGRRVDRLRDDELLSSCIISPDDIKRDLIIAFKLTETGQDTIVGKREEFLRETVKQQIFSRGGMELEKPVLSELIRNHFDLDTDIKHRLQDEYTHEELTTFLTLYYIKRQVADVFSNETAEKLAELAQRSDEVEAAFGQNMLETKISEQLEAQ
jgi:hypothetical protein